jgi:alpha-glucosidase
MYIIYDAPLTMLCDSPTNYEKEPEFTKFIAQIPTVWHHRDFSTSSVIGEYVQAYAISKVDDRGVVKEWYIAGLNGNKERSVVVSTAVEYMVDSVEVFMDGDNASEDGTDYKHFVVPIEEYHDNDCSLSINIAPGGGFVIKYTCY